MPQYIGMGTPIRVLLGGEERCFVVKRHKIHFVIVLRLYAVGYPGTNLTGQVGRQRFQTNYFFKRSLTA